MRTLDCTAFLHAKIATGDPDSFDSFGIMDEEDVRVNLLNTKFSRADTHVAVQDCVKLKVLDLYYKVPCSSCGQHSHIKETDVENKSKGSEIVKTGFCCRHCQEFEKAMFPLDTRYAISNMYLGGWEEDDKYKENIFKRWCSGFLRIMRS